MNEDKTKPIPKKACIINIMFPIVDDTEALAVKQQIDDAIENVKEKRYSFQITEG